MNECLRYNLRSLQSVKGMMLSPKRGSSKNLNSSIASKVPRKAAGAADGSATTRSASGSCINEVTPAKSKDKHNQQVDKYKTFPMQNPYLKKDRLRFPLQEPSISVHIKHTVKAKFRGGGPKGKASIHRKGVLLDPPRVNLAELTFALNSSATQNAKRFPVSNKTYPLVALLGKLGSRSSVCSWRRW